MIRRWQNMLASEDWQQVAAPVLKVQIEHFLKMLRTPRKLRKPELSSDYISGALDAFEYLLTWPPQQVDAALTELANEIIAKQFDVVYEDNDTQGQPLREES